MASHVVVIDSSARRATVKVTPVKHLSDVLSEACTKLGVDSSQYGLKHNNKQVDLTLSFRLSGLSSGAKLQLVQQSRSTSVVSVALDIRETPANGGATERLVDKFPSTTTLWQVLRKFEAGVAGGVGTRNLTARSVATTDTGSSGAGRLFYQTPVLHVMNRELSSFTDLQKTLGQLGFNGGSALLRLSFRDSTTPMEQAVAEIEEYFKSTEGDQAPAEPAVASSSLQDSIANTQPTVKSAQDDPAPETQSSQASVAIEPTTSSPPSQTLQSTSTSTSTSTLPAKMTVYAPPTSSTPQAASTPHNPSDYIPTIQHAQTHQKLLATASRNNRLLTDSELAAQEAAAKESLAAIDSVEVKIRFPDQSQVQITFDKTTTGQGLRDFVRESCLDEAVRNEAFILDFWSAGGKGKLIISENDNRRLIEDMGMKGRVLINFTWAPTVNSAVRDGSKDILRPELRRQAQDLLRLPSQFGP